MDRVGAVRITPGLQHYGTVGSVPIALDVSVRGVGVENLDPVLVDTMTLRDLYRDEGVQIARLLQAHEIVLNEARAMARHSAQAGGDGTNDLLVSDVIRTDERRVWFVAEHLADTLLIAHEQGPA
jgi:hypothetical protein